MTNFEYHKEEIERLLLEKGIMSFGVVGDKIQNCDTTNCTGCIFSKAGGCGKARVEWLNKEYEESITVQTLNSGFRNFCSKNPKCVACEFYRAYSCKFEWLMKNYNLTKKENNENDK